MHGGNVSEQQPTTVIHLIHKARFGGNSRSGGKRLSGKTRKGSPWLGQKLCQRAEGPSRRKNRSTAAFFERSTARAGVGQPSDRSRQLFLLVVRYYLLPPECHFQDVGVYYFDQLNHQNPVTISSNS
jgi:transposase